MGTFSFLNRPEEVHEINIEWDGMYGRLKAGEYRLLKNRWKSIAV